MSSNALEAARRAIELEPRNAIYHVTLGEALDASGDVDGAAMVYQKALGLDAESVFKAFRDSVTLKPNDAHGWKSFSTACTEMGRLLEGRDPIQRRKILIDAIDAARKAIGLEPEMALYHRTLGDALEASGDADGAIEAYRKALELDPHEENSINRLKRLGKPSP